MLLGLLESYFSLYPYALRSALRVSRPSVSQLEKEHLSKLQPIQTVVLRIEDHFAAGWRLFESDVPFLMPLAVSSKSSCLILQQ